MLVSSAVRYRLFSHRPGVVLPIPGTSFSLRVFPARLELLDLSESAQPQVWSLELPVHGPVEQWTVTLDLERGELKVSGETPAGSIRYAVRPGKTSRQVWFIDLKKSGLELFPDGELFLTFDGPNWPVPKHHSRLNMGISKAQNLVRAEERELLDEYLPFWWHLSQWLPVPDQPQQSGMNQLLEAWQEAIASKTPEAIDATCRQLLRCGFEHVVCPRLEDRDHHGVVPRVTMSGSPLRLLADIQQRIRSMLVDDAEAGTIRLLPALAPELHCGRWIEVPVACGQMDLEWTKKTARRMILRTTNVEESLLLDPGRGVRSFRVRLEGETAGKTITKGNAMQLMPHSTYYFDRFSR